jgi:hypothetical protein
MKRVLLLIIFGLFLISFVSADILINQQPKALYSLGDVAEIPIKITTLSEINNFLTVSLICNGAETEVHKEYILLSPGEEKSSQIKIPLITSFTGKAATSCSAKAQIGEQYLISNEFKISDKITLEIKEQTSEAKPGTSATIIGIANKANQANAEGFIEASLKLGETEQLNILDTIRKGFFELNLSLPEELPAGEYTVNLHAYEKDIVDQITNQGNLKTTLTIIQIPTSLEVSIEENQVTPGTDLKVKAILHDQTGEKISAETTITIKNSLDKIIEQVTLQTDELHSLSIPYNELPAEWKIEAVSGELTGENFFSITKLEKVETIILNKTLLIKNIGNVPYNKTLPVKIGDQTLDIKVQLQIDQEKKYALNAPNGKYEVEIQGQSQNALLTGKAIDVKEVKALTQIIQFPLVWMFIIGILGFISYLFFKKGYNKTFVGYITKKRAKKNPSPLRKNSLVKSNNKAELSLSIKGNKQKANLICLRIKNLKDIEGKKGSVEGTLQQIVQTAEENKAATYENNENIFFLFVPSQTKTMNNSKNTLATAQSIKRILDHANRLFKDKIDYGIALNTGTILAKQDPESLKFMSMGTLITESKKIASESKGEILLGEKIKEETATFVKTEKIEGATKAYKIKQIKTEKAEDKKFITNFIKRLEGQK